jgi:hypothetical protein
MIRVMTTARRELLNDLDELAGDPEIVDDGFRYFRKRGQSPTLSEMVEYIEERLIKQYGTRSPAHSADESPLQLASDGEWEENRRVAHGRDDGRPEPEGYR